MEFDYQGRNTSCQKSTLWAKIKLSVSGLILDVSCFVLFCYCSASIPSHYNNFLMFFETISSNFQSVWFRLFESCTGHAIPVSSIGKVHLDSSDWFKNGCMIQVCSMIINPRRFTQLWRSSHYLDA